MTDRSPDLSPKFDDEAYCLIGRIIAAWSRIHEFIHGEIGVIQTRIYLLQQRAGGNRSDDVPGFAPWRIIPDTLFRLRLKYYRRLVRALAQGDEAILKQLDTATKDLPDLYAFRCDLAHSEVYAYVHQPKIELTSHEWLDRWTRDLFQKEETPPFPPTLKTYTLDHLQKELKRMEQAFHNLLHIDLPMHGVPEHPRPPSRRPQHKSPEG